MAASHSGEDRHVAVVEGLLARADFAPSILQCGVHPPYDSETAERLLRDGEPLTPLRHNCSGKHAGMALFARAADWPVETYWEQDHPVQRAALGAVSAATGVDRDQITLATDGCGVPTFGMPLRALATGFARLADPASISPLASIRTAMTAHPELVAGERRRLDTALMRAVPGLVAKAGAEGIQAIGLQPGLTDATGAVGGSQGAVGVALVIEDGDAARRAASVASCAALAQLGVLDHGTLETLEAFSAPVVRDPRDAVSAVVRPAFSLG